jgi:extradiol dioxygenase family protein
MDWNPELVVVPVTDVERARRFYGEQVGFASTTTPGSTTGCTSSS